MGERRLSAVTDHELSAMLDQARARGHDLVDDPPAFATADRWTCKRCGRGVLFRNFFYGSALTSECDRGD